MRTYKATLSMRALDKLIGDLKDYRDSLGAKMEALVNRLLELGIETAQHHSTDVPGRYGTHKMGQYVSFKKEIKAADGSCTGLLVAMGDTLDSVWYGPDGEKRYGTINAMMALEFGTAAKAVSVRESFGVTGGQGTNSQYGHENDLEWWIAESLDSNGKPTDWKRATAITPTRPLMHAGNEMASEIANAAREVFGAS